MNLGRFVVLVALLVAPLSGCGLGLPPAGDYATVFGQVTNAAGQPVAGATVLVNDVLSTTTDASGNFTLSPVPTGAWSYTVTAPNYKSVGSTSPPPLTPGEKRNFPIRLSPTAPAARPSGGRALAQRVTAGHARIAAHAVGHKRRARHARRDHQRTIARRVSAA